MGRFTYKEIVVENGKRVLEINILPEKYCNFDCIFCPIGRSSTKVDTQMTFDDFEASMQEFEEMIQKTRPDLIFINSKGEAFVNDKIDEIISFIKSKGLQIKLLSNGYLLGNGEYKKIANRCDAVIGEIKVINENDFQRVQRPMAGYTLEEYIFNMASFIKQYEGKFIFEITIIKGYNDDHASVKQLKKIIKFLAPSEVLVVRIEDEPFKKKLGVADERFEEIVKELSEVLKK